MKQGNHAYQVELLIALMDQAYSRKAWHGPNFRGSLRGLPAHESAWRPAAGRHCIWEIVLHVAYWKYAVRRMLTQEKRGSFPRRGSNWLPLPAAATEENWRADLALLEQEHRLLREAVAALTDPHLRRHPRGSRYTVATLVSGIASHDLYHAGQIQLLKRLHDVQSVRLIGST